MGSLTIGQDGERSEDGAFYRFFDLMPGASASGRGFADCRAMRQTLPGKGHQSQKERSDANIPSPCSSGKPLRRAAVSFLLLAGTTAFTPLVMKKASAQTANYQNSTSRPGSGAPSPFHPAGPGVNIDIPAGSLSDALVTFSTQAHAPLTSQAPMLAGKTTAGLRGTFTPPAALSRLLQGTGLSYLPTGSHAYKVVVASSAITLGPVRVSGQLQQSLAGLLDSADTLHDGRYSADRVTVAGKLPLSVRQIPNSVSVVTQQRILDQNMVSVEDVLRFTTGVTASPYGDGTAYFMSRGYTLDVQYDGMPVVSGIQYLPQFDMMMYDRVEVMRGPTGLLQGTGSGAGSVNLVRKHTQDAFATHVGVQAGSWNNVRPYIDINAPLNASHTLRARIVASGQSADSFVHEVHQSEAMLYAIVDYDIDAQTRLTVSGSYQYSDRGPFDYGQSRYTNNKFLNFPRSAFFGSSWNDSPNSMGEGYVNITHSFGKNLIWSTSVIDRYLDSSGIYSYMGGGVNFNTKLSKYFEQSNLNRQNMIGADSNLNYRMNIMGRPVDFLVGTNMYQVYKRSLYGSGPTSALNIFDAVLPKPNFPYSGGNDTTTEQWGAYAQARLHPIKNLTLVLGGRVSSYWADSRTILPERLTRSGQPGVEGKLTPNAGMLYDLTRELTAYFSFSSIFTPQTELTASGGGLKPVTGRQYEAGLKGAFLSGNLLAFLAAFQLETNNRAVGDPTDIRYYVSSGRARSRGVEVEINGRPLPGWNIYAGYTWLETQYLSDPVYGNLSLQPEEPKHNFKLWSTYTIQRGMLKDLSFGTGLLVSSRTSRDYVVWQGGYTVLDLQVGYKVTPHLSTTLTVNNVADKVYWARLPTSYYGSYGAPRSVMAAIRSEF
ncbi:TonB-dependent siderophore receptor [Gluconacetobacter sp. 1c LMG 22058]|uniref:TonB-dependent siderophore receptor n=1 Tax=Gluconacetobacter dulcium TaxID=2729096 RepID=A0A7W4JWA6_9PROT|nr:TonB-dependent siderophore receptor [Gluconacetobacter dulcium]MBB2195874.1 TonB-dependent siderophore receptor [Gluconacetobacter dulcium]